LHLQHVTHVLTKQLSIAKVSTKIATAADESLSKQQKALFLRQQLAAELQRVEPVNTDLHGSRNIFEDEDDLDVLVRRVDALPESTVVRNYVRTSGFFSLPHVPSLTLRSARMAYRSVGPHRHLARIPLRGPTSSPTQSRNSADHSGLDKVRRRPTENFPFVRLRALIAQEAGVGQVKAQEVVLKDAIEGG
jgi:ATP-dependent Lon protease